MLISRSEENPILTPNKKQSWEAEAVFNGCPVEKDGKVFLLYRALSLPHYHSLAEEKLMVSDIGRAESEDGINFKNRSRYIFPEHAWERYGCEDPRVTFINGKYYTFYTALSEYPPKAEGIKVAVAVSKDLQTVDEKHIVTPFNAKAMTLFPEEIHGKMWAMFTLHSDQPPAKICLVPFEKEEDMWNEAYMKDWYAQHENYVLNLQRRPQDHVEIGAPPIKTEDGWLVLYSYIRNYFNEHNRIFSVEAVLLDPENPLKIKARYNQPLLIPEEYYEKYGMVKNIVFPSGALKKGDTIDLYYGSADTTCSVAHIDYIDLRKKLLGQKSKIMAKRAKNNPILEPIPQNDWEARLVFNPAAIYLDDTFHIVYRAMSNDNTSVFGYASSKDGLTINYRHTEPIYTPRESFEDKKNPGGYSGCEDPRLSLIGDTIYMLYTAYDGVHVPRVALSTISKSDFLAKEWNWSKPVLITAPEIDDKDAGFFDEKINGKYVVIHRVGDDIDLAHVDSLDFDGATWLEEYRWIVPRRGMWDGKKVGIAAPPIKTEDGWVLFYHGVSDEDGYYRVGVCLISPDDLHVIARSDMPIFEPETEWEKVGEVNNVVFPCGIVLKDGTYYIYYGGADEVVGVATITHKEIMSHLLG